MSDLSPQAQQLLSTLGEDGPSEADFARIRSQLDAQLSATPGEGPSAPTGASPAVALPVKIGAGVFGFAGIALTVALNLQAPKPDAELVPPPVYDVRVETAPQPEAPPTAAPELPQIQPQAPQVPPVKRLRAAPPAPALIPAPEPAVVPAEVVAEPMRDTLEPLPSLAEELALLQRAREALANHEAQRALNLLDLYPARFSHGRLRDEYQAARALTLCNLGRHAEGLAAASLAQTSAYQSAIEAACQKK